MNTPTLTPLTDDYERDLISVAGCRELWKPINLEFARALEIEMTAECDQLRAQLRALTLICGTNDANKFETWIDRANARAERAEAAETVALARWNGALERAMKAEADLVALGQCHDDNCRAVVKIAAELATERARLRQVALDACKSAQIKPVVWYPTGYNIDPNDFGKINEQQVEACVAAIDAAIKEDSK